MSFIRSAPRNCPSPWIRWQVNTLSLVQGVSVAVLLLFVGWALYHETLTWQKLMGAAFCLVGLFFINK